MTKNSPSFDQADKIRSGRRPLTRTRPKKNTALQQQSQILKNLKIHKITYEIFFDLAPIPAGTSAKMIPIVVLLSAAVEKKTKTSHLDPQNGPVLWPGQSTICEYLLYSTHSISDFEGGRKV